MERWFSAWLFVLLTAHCQHIEPVRIRTKLSQTTLQETNTFYLLGSNLVEQDKWQKEAKRFAKLSIENHTPNRCIYLNNEAVYRSLLLSVYIKPANSKSINLLPTNNDQWQNIMTVFETALSSCSQNSYIEENFRTAFVISRNEKNQ